MLGVHDQDDNEVPHAFVVHQPTTAGPTEGEVMRYVAARVAPGKRIRRVTFVAEVPRSAAGKILRRALREPGERS
ncbi:AMP-binding enzyme [Streptomyces sp. NPDC002514]|uniref:AMP-binding enzyme n=1 Tax=unclassified Streptomyces TaxID=2593676 RepID=UPI0036ACB68B